MSFFCVPNILQTDIKVSICKAYRILLLKLLPLLILSFCTYAYGAQITIQVESTGKKSIIETVENGGSVSVPVMKFAEVLGYRANWDRYSEQLTLLKNNDSLSFIQGNFFCRKNGVVLQLPSAVERVGGHLYISIKEALKLFKPSDGELKWNAQSRIVSIKTSKYSIASVFCDKKQNGTLLTINLADSLLFDITYFHPNLLINFIGGTVDTQKIRNNETCGLISSLSTVQFKQSAQVSVVLNRKIEQPVYDYIQDTKTLMLSLRAEKAEHKTPVDPSSTLQVETLKTIVIDPGHGGKDPGAIGVSGVKEKNITLNIALKLKDILKKTEGIKVYLTREKDVFIPLQERTKFANDKKADLFISIHADAISGNTKRKEAIKGYKVYFLSQAKNEEDKLVAMRENAVIELEERPQNYSSLHNVLIDLAGNEYLKESQDLCILLDQKFSEKLEKKVPKLHLGVGQANFWVLNGAYMTSVLVEVGFLSNSKEEKIISDNNTQKEIALSISEAILKFKKSYEGAGYE